MTRFAAPLAALAVALLLAPSAAAVTIDWILVGAPGNPGDGSAGGAGAVPEVFRMGRHEVTNAQYAEFLNAVAADDPHALWNPDMAATFHGGIGRLGTPGSYSYVVKGGYADRPVVYTSFWDALRFVNWLHNGQGAADTETGAYDLTGGPSDSVARLPGASHFVPDVDEWHKSAYYDPATGSFRAYPAGADAQTTCFIPGATPNTANCEDFNGTHTNGGAFTASASPNGTFDQGGNVWEWTEDVPVATERAIRGGGFLSPASDLASTRAESRAADFEGKDYGFRVAAPSGVPVPLTGPFARAVLALGLVAAACLLKPRAVRG